MPVPTHRSAGAKAARSGPATSRVGARWECRMTEEVQALIKRASEISGRSMTDFVLSAATAAAHETIAQAQRVELALADQQRFAEALLAPAEPTDALVRAFARRRERMGPL